MRLILYQPDIASNFGALLRLCACMGVPCHVIEPCGFPLDDRRMKRAGMDYVEQVELVRHASWEEFQKYIAFPAQAGIQSPQGDPGLRREGGREDEDGIKNRLILLSTKAATPYTQFQFQPGDMLLLGRESAGVPDAVRDACDATVTIPMQPPARSLNVAMAAAMVLGEALRQVRG